MFVLCLSTPGQVPDDFQYEWLSVPPCPVWTWPRLYLCQFLPYGSVLYSHSRGFTRVYQMTEQMARDISEILFPIPSSHWMETEHSSPCMTQLSVDERLGHRLSTPRLFTLSVSLAQQAEFYCGLVPSSSHVPLQMGYCCVPSGEQANVSVINQSFIYTVSLVWRVVAYGSMVQVYKILFKILPFLDKLAFKQESYYSRIHNSLQFPMLPIAWRRWFLLLRSCGAFSPSPVFPATVTFFIVISS